MIKHIPLVCLVCLCLFGNKSIQAEKPLTLMNVAVTTVIPIESENDIIMTVTGLEILIESVEEDDIILAADLYDSNQQVVLSERLSNAANSMTLDISGLSSGYYVLQVQTTTDVESFQLHIH